MIYTFSLKNKVVLLTGGYGYLGRAIASSLIYHGAKVYVLGRTLKKFKDAFNENAELNKRLLFQKCDISKTKSIKEAFDVISRRENKIDVLINNAFYIKGQDPYEMTDEEWSIGIAGSLSSVFKCIREILPYFKKNESCKIISTSSMYGVSAPDFSIYEEFPEFLNPPHYGAAKAGIVQLTKYYASLLGDRNVTVNCVTPGPFPNKKVQDSKGFIEALEDKTCLNRIGEPEDLAGTFVFLSSDAANYITGQNIIVDGGWTIK